MPKLRQARPLSSVKLPTAAALPAWPALLVAALATLPYWQSLRFAFLSWDDDQNIFANPWLLSGDWPRFWTAPYNGLYVPLPYTLWTILYKIAPQPWLFHAANVVLHGINSGLVVRICQRLTADRPAAHASPAVWPPLLAGLIFGLHPLQIETVAWIAGFRDLTCTLLALVAILIYLNATPGRRWSYLAATAAFAGSLFCKPTAAVLPIALFAIAILLQRQSHKSALLALLPWCLLALPFAVATAHIQLETIDATYDTMSVAQRAFIALDTLGFYIAKLCLPRGLAVDYGRLPRLVLTQAALLYPALGITATLGLAAAFLTRRRGPLLAGAAIFAIFLLPTSGIVPFAFQRISSVSDRYMYLPMLGVALAIAALIGRAPAAVRVATLPAVLLLGVLTLGRTQIWADDTSLFTSMLATNPNSFSANAGLGTIALNQRDFVTALAYYEKSLAAQPTNVLALANTGLALDQLGREQEVVTRIAPHIPDAATIERSPLSAPGIARLFAVVGFAQARVVSVEAGLTSYCRAQALAPGDRDLTANISALRQQLTAQKQPLPTACQGVVAP